MHYYKRNIGDYAKKAGRLTMLQHGAYTLLLDACYDRERFPTMDEAIEWTWASSPAEVEAVQFVLSRFFKLVDGVYMQTRIQEEIADFEERSATNSRIARERETKRREKSTNRDRNVDDSAPDDHESPPTHYPLPTNLEGKPSIRSAPCPYDEITNLYMECLPTLPKVIVSSNKRRSLLKKRWSWILTSKKQDGTRRAENKEQALDWLRAYFERVSTNPFLLGDNDRGWKADIDYLMEDRGLKTVIERTQ